MKKTLLTFLTLCLAVFTATAQSYTESLVVTVDGVSTDPQSADITVVKSADGKTCDFALKNFCLVDGESNIPVGNITLKGVSMKGKGYCTEIATTQTIQIENGDDESVSEWLGPMLGDVPVVLTGQLTDEHLYVNIDIDMTEGIGQVINVVAGVPIEEPTLDGETGNYTEDLIVSVNGVSTDPQAANIIVTRNKENTLCNFTLKNFALADGESNIPVGNITLKCVTMRDSSFCYNLSTSQTITIESGDDESVTDWMGPLLGDVPVVLTGQLTDDHLYVNIDIDMTDVLGQVINVVAGSPIEEPGLDGETFEYSEDLTVTVNGESSTPQLAHITVTRNKENTLCDFTLKNFSLVDGESNIPVGNITLKGVTMEDMGNYYTLSTSQSITIKDGDDESVSEWLGPMLGEVPVVLTGKMTDTQLYANIDIDMQSTLGQTINVVVGSSMTGIDIISTTSDAVPASGVYTLSGVRVADTLTPALSKGVYVVNGKKVVK